jgi:predicted DsbA family dithiol-disulfide isomerase
MERDMSDHFEGAVCGVGGCTPAELDHFETASDAKATLAIEVISDAICPWCWVAKRRPDRAIAALAPDVTVSVTWRPFELNPEMPKAPARLPLGQVWVLAALTGARRARRRGRTIGGACVQP